MATTTSRHLSELTNGGLPNIQACRKDNSALLYDYEKPDRNASITYIVFCDELQFYLPNKLARHPDYPAMQLARVSVKSVDAVCCELTEEYKFVPSENEFEIEDLPDDTFSLTSSEYSEAIQLHPEFWETKPGPPIEKDGSWVCDESNLGALSEWARGFVGDATRAKLPDGMMRPTKDQELNAFPACHPKYGVTDYLDSGAEWRVTRYRNTKPCESDLGELHTRSVPYKLCGADKKNWLYVGVSADGEGGLWQWTYIWRYSKAEWDEDIYEDGSDPI